MVFKQSSERLLCKQSLTGWYRTAFFIYLLLLSFMQSNPALGQTASEPNESRKELFKHRDEQRQAVSQFVKSWCVDCHTADDPAGEFELESFDDSANSLLSADFDSRQWEKIWRRISARQMPPADADRPSEKKYNVAIADISQLLHNQAEQFPRPGRTGSLRRMTRTEYRNAIRDLLAIEIDVESLLPKDESSHGFDNITVEELSPTLMNRYLSAAQKISRAAVGSGQTESTGVTIRVPADQTQDEHVEGLPLGTRGGTVFTHHFPQAGEYEIDIKLTRDRDEKVEGLDGEHQIDLLIDRGRVHQFTVDRPPGKGEWQDYTHADSHLKKRVKVTAGPHAVGVTFPKRDSALRVTKRQPFDASFNRHRHPRQSPAIFQVTVVGPFSAEGAGDTPSRHLIFSDTADTSQQNLREGQRLLSKLMRRAYRRPITDDDLQSPMFFFKEGLRENGFEAGVESALASILINPNFLFRVETDPEPAVPGTSYRISDLELASRLSFFLWSSIPDEVLLDLAEAGQLADADILASQVDRMLRSEKSDSLVTNFAAQWLYLRNLNSITPDLRLFPDFDDNLRQSFRRETELLFDDMLRHDRSMLNLLSADYTFLNQRLAKHYGVPHVFGSHFRRVQLEPESRRGGLLRQGSILTVTSYATRTSPTIRGNWVLENILGTPAPPPPPNVPNLKEKTALRASSLRERLAQHRADTACAGCHNLMDPVGFAMENFDAVGRWREYEDILPIDTSGELPDGAKISGVDDLEAAIMNRPEMFVGTLTEKLMTFALGRGIEFDDGPAVRQIVSDSANHQFRFSSIIKGIVLSRPFQMRSVP